MLITLKTSYPVPSKKNRKRIANGKLVTDPEVQHILEMIIQDFLQQLYSEFVKHMETAKTPTTCTPALWTASFMPYDDSVEYIARSQINVEFVEPGQEETLLTIGNYEV